MASIVRKTIIDEEGFEPCYDEKCDKDELHPAHDLDKVRNRLFCPLCTSRLVKLGTKKRFACSECQWRGSKSEAVLGAKKHA